ncbi:carboxylic ester hydrolase [Planomonospora parontospora subsp. parontospora]|uniref:Carboxylic ester hydrolase n=2 Tax=Planomonospora parontospora TaxID=58119 RepID=A0AA37BLF6_9ACTN|nr:carboxylesterase family protein [Planomonospora parontospora]GGK87570.1 carboxylic ester hydrolase [Planomonospora parontospora]GII11399.1 carboxylic ester hydrolase [Planomonospora parontospora subsp. parontospora]
MDPQVVTASGRVRGRWTGGVAEFLGVPYAAPPVGALRFAPPVPPPRWDGVRSCRTCGPTAPQPQDGGGDVPEPLVAGDDFLNLNVRTPDPGAAGLPVLVWIHGGAFNAGGNAGPWYRGASFARDGLVFVAINYRLGVEGFLPLDDAPANLGVLDWIRALTWVHDNIAAFGGDPGNVTVGGQSAGGQASVTLLAAPAAAGLLHRVIDMSGGSVTWEPVEPAREAARALARRLGVPPTREAFSAFTPEELAAAYGSLGSGEPDPGPLGAVFGPGPKGFNPVNDGETVVRSPYDMIRDGSAHPAALLVGTTREEFNALVRSRPGPLGEREYGDALRALGAGPDARRFYEERLPAGREVLGQILTDRLFRVPALRLARACAAAGRSVHAYEFRWRSPARDGTVGAGHCVDLPFVFDDLDAEGVERLCGPAPPPDLARTVHAAWTGFAATGDPGWPPYGGPGGPVRIFDDPGHLACDPLAAEGRLWREP